MKTKTVKNEKDRREERMTLKDWEALVIDKKDIKSNEDSQKILREMRYGSISC